MKKALIPIIGVSILLSSIVLCMYLYIKNLGESIQFVPNDTKIGANQTDDEVIASLENELISEQEEWIKTHSKYKEKSKAERLPGNIKYSVDEYVVWDGNEIPKEKGYIITYENKDGYIRATGTGEHGKNESFSWKLLPIVDTISSTSSTSTQ